MRISSEQLSRYSSLVSELEEEIGLEVALAFSAHVSQRPGGQLSTGIVCNLGILLPGTEGEDEKEQSWAQLVITEDDDGEFEYRFGKEGAISSAVEAAEMTVRDKLARLEGWLKVQEDRVRIGKNEARETRSWLETRGIEPLEEIEVLIVDG